MMSQLLTLCQPADGDLICQHYIVHTNLTFCQHMIVIL